MGIQEPAGITQIPEDLKEDFDTATAAMETPGLGEHRKDELRRVIELIERIAAQEARWEEHTKHVGRFLTEMYQTMIDPCDEPEPSVKIAELCEMLLNQAREDREKLNRAPANLPADWDADSSLETWFPLTAKELRALQAERDALREALKQMKTRYDVALRPYLYGSTEQESALPSPGLPGEPERQGG
jgi:hypothetical protein